jgi:hypothetical protein
MKKLITIVFLLVFTTGAFSQTSFKVRIDSIFNLDGFYNYFKNQLVKKCLDNGYIITWGSYIDWAQTEAFLIKTDSIGTIEWHKTFTATGYDDAWTNIALTSDSGFYFEMESSYYDYSFTFVDFMKLDKYGNIVTQKTTYPSNFTYKADAMKFVEVEKNTDNLIVLGLHWGDNGGQNPCCDTFYIQKYDTSINILFSKKINLGSLGRISAGRKIYDPGTGAASGYLVAGSSDYPPYRFEVLKLNNNAQAIWKMDYLVPNSVINDNQIWDILQVDSTYYLLEKNAVREIDYYGNTLFYEILDTVSTNNFIFSGMIRGDNNHLLIGGIKSPPASPVLLEMDMNGSIVQAKIGTDSSNYFSGIGTSTKAFLFLKGIYTTPIYKSMEFKREFINNPSCNFVPLTLYPSNGISQDSSVIGTVQPYNFTLSPVSISSVASPLTGTLICSSTTAINEINKETNQLIIFPNPATNEFQISNYNFQTGDEVIMVNFLGKILFTKKITSPTSNIKLQTSNFSNGIYFLELKTKEGVLNKKVVVQH